MKVYREVRVYLTDGSESATMTPPPGEENYLEIVFENVADKTKCEVAMDKEELEAFYQEATRLLNMMQGNKLRIKEEVVI